MSTKLIENINLLFQIKKILILTQILIRHEVFSVSSNSIFTIKYYLFLLLYLRCAFVLEVKL